MAMGSAQRHGFCVVGFVGPSGTGKTSLLEALIPALQQRGLRVGAVKHAHHGFAADRTGKDSHRLYESGAEAVSLISKEQIAGFTRRSSDDESASLEEALATLPPDLDVVLAEGFSWEPIPRVVLVPEADPENRKPFAGNHVVETIRVPTAAPGEKPCYPASVIELLVERIAALARRAAPATRPRRGTVDVERVG